MIALTCAAPPRPRGDRGGVHRAHRDGDFLPGNAVGAGDALGGADVEPGAVVLGDDEDPAAHSRPFFFSASRSSAASFTLTPFWRCGGRSKRTSFSCSGCSPPRGPQGGGSRGV